jgi:hypothetical protein
MSEEKNLFGKEDEIFNFLSLEDTEITEEIARMQDQIGKKEDKINILGQKQVKVRSLMQQFKKPEKKTAKK